VEEGKIAGAEIGGASSNAEAAKKWGATKKSGAANETVFV
jgi:hypothetical protein